METFKSDYFAPVIKQAIPVKLAALSVVIPVPKGCGSPLVFPEDVPGDEGKKMGMPICNGKGIPKGTGIVFRNYTDGAVQAARDDGKEVIIANALTESQADWLFNEYKRLIPEPSSATSDQINQVLDYAHKRVGIKDFLNSDRDKIPEYDAQSIHPDEPDCGIFIRRIKEDRFALLGVGCGAFEGPASSPQNFVGTVVAVRNARNTWLVQTAEFLRTYTHPDDSPIALAELPAFEMRHDTKPSWAEPKLAEVADAVRMVSAWMKEYMSPDLDEAITYERLRRQPDKVELGGFVIARMPPGIYDPKDGYGVSIDMDRVKIQPGTISYGREIPQPGRFSKPVSDVTHISPRYGIHPYFAKLLDNKEIVERLQALQSSPTDTSLSLGQPACVPPKGQTFTSS